MLCTSKLDQPYDKCPIRANVWYICDYCGVEFRRTKKQRERHNRHVNKDSCGSADCKLAKRREVAILLHPPEIVTVTTANEDQSSAIANEAAEWLNLLGCNFKRNTIIGGLEVTADFGCKIALDICCLSSTSHARSYHYDRYKVLGKSGFRLLTIFDDEWIRRHEQCLGALRIIVNQPIQVFQARNCSAEIITKDECVSFYEHHHLLGPSRHGLFFAGLRHAGTLVGCMSLGRHPRDSSSITLDRMCFQSGVRVLGGAGKLLRLCTAYARGSDCNRIITWSDNRWSNGNVYAKIGFELDAELGPEYFYVDRNHYTRISKQSQKKSNTGCPSDMTEKEWAEKRGLVQIWDCGKKRWILHLGIFHD